MGASRFEKVFYACKRPSPAWGDLPCLLAGGNPSQAAGAGGGIGGSAYAHVIHTRPQRHFG